MSLTTLSFLSFLLCVAITAYSAVYAEHHGGQSLRESMVEAWTNIVIGFSINYIANLVILPMAVEGLTLSENFMIGWIYTAISMVRSLLIRRYYNRKLRSRQCT
jgi:hypothetical protein